LSGTALEVAGDTGIIVRIVERVLKCARLVVPSARSVVSVEACAVAVTPPGQPALLPAAPAARPGPADQPELPAPPAIPATSPDPSNRAAFILSSGGVPPACLVETLRKHACASCPHATADASNGSVPHGYCANCGHYRHIDTIMSREQLRRYCKNCERPFCYVCESIDNKEHTFIELPQARDNLMVSDKISLCFLIVSHSLYFAFRLIQSPYLLARAPDHPRRP